jgi:DNA topoisomerase-1
VTLTPQAIKSYLSADQFKLYNLIWRRFVASFMTSAVFDTVRVDIVAKQYVFRTTGSNLKFQGFYTVWPREEDEKLLPVMQVSEVLDLHGLKPEQHFTQPPPRYSEASLIKELEEQGIGRPSTYVPIISTIQDRGYVDQEQRRFVPTWLGETVNEMLNKHFPNIVDTGFTAEMERKLDDVEEGRCSWTEFLRSFYSDFKVTMEKAEAEMDRVQKPLEEMDELCPECGERNLVIRTGRFGRFISCSGFPECRYRRSFVMKTGAHCPLCKGDLVERKTRQKKRVFYGCNNYPTCNFAIWERPVPDTCPNCGGLMVIPKGGQDPVCYEEVLSSQRSLEDKPQQDGEGQPKRGTRRKKASEEALLETSSGNANEISSKAKRGTRKKKVPEVTNSDISLNGAHVTGSKTARKKTTIAISDENTQDTVLQDTITHEITNGHVSAKTAKAMARKR